MSIFVEVSKVQFKGDRIQALREERGWSQSELGRRSDLTQVSIGNYEAGARDPKTIDLAAIAKALGTTSAYLLHEIDDPSPDALKNVGRVDLDIYTRMAPGEEASDEELFLLQEKLDTIIALERAKKAKAEREWREKKKE